MRRPDLRLALALAVLVVLAVCAPAVARAAPVVRAGGPLATNGLASPLCEDPATASRLGVRSQGNCAISGITAAPAPISNYQFDVHIDTGVLGFTSDLLVQDLLLTPLWNALVWLVHALIVGLEWCYSLNLLGGGPLRQIGDVLHSAQSTFTQPWLVVVLAIAAVLLVYEGIVRRRVADTIGQAATTVAMIVGGLVLIANPAGTVGALSRTVNDASLGTVATLSAGTPDRAERTFADGIGGVFAAAVDGPWCYLEFGDVGWCQDPARVDPALRAAAQRIEASDRSALPDGRPPAVLGTEATLLGRARTNGEFFLALPANGPLRNSINDQGSLLHVICRGSDLGHCTGPAATEAQFRTAAGTSSRAGGLLFIAIGTVGMLALLGFLALRLLAAALMSVLYLLLAPVAVLAPALGEGGRAAFRTWSARLLGALVAKLVYSVLLGVVLLMLRVLLSLGALGWWTQWLLVSSLWWIAYAHRDRLLAHVFRDQPRRPLPLPGPPAAQQLLRIARRPARSVLGAASTIVDQGRQFSQRPPRWPGGGAPAPDPKTRDAKDRAGGVAVPAPASSRERARRSLDDQVLRTLGSERAHAQALVAGAEQRRIAVAERRRRLTDALAVARDDGDSRRAASLAVRLERLDAEAEPERAARQLLAAGDPSERGSDAHAMVRHRAAELDRAAVRGRAANDRDGVPAERPGAPRPSAPARALSQRDYLPLTELAGVARDDYERMQPGARRRVRLEVDRELERRRDWIAATVEAPRAPGREGTPSEPLVPRADPAAPHTDPIVPRAKPIPRSPRQRQFTREQFEDLLG